ncbi:MAG: hypothetical protein WC498_02295 [Candidatus Saccharimonadales bacterium]
MVYLVDMPKTSYRPRGKRNTKLFDTWSLVHLASGLLTGWLVDPFIGLIILVLYEPFENFILSPILWRFNISYGYESIQNSLSDIFFDCIGVALGYYILQSLITPPFRLF